MDTETQLLEIIKSIESLLERPNHVRYALHIAANGCARFHFTAINIMNDEMLVSCYGITLSCCLHDTRMIINNAPVKTKLQKIKFYN